MRTLFFFLICFSLLLCFCLFISMVGESAIDLPFRTQLNAISFVPQGWAFFTLDARSERMLVYRPADMAHPVDMSASQAAYLFGLNRKGRTCPYELQSILQQSPGKWADMEQPLNTLNVSDLSCDTVLSQFPNPILKKELLIVRTKPVPWAWSGLSAHLPYKIKRVYVK